MTPTYSSAQVAALSVISQLIVPRTVLSTALVCCFVSGWTICIMSGFRLVKIIESEGWPSVPADAVWPSIYENEPLRTHGWPSIGGGVTVEVEVRLVVEEVEGHSACRCLWHSLPFCG
jgi:hypothetical protein